MKPVNLVARLLPTHAHWHRHRNRHNQCPAQEPINGFDDKGHPWVRDNRLNEVIFHGGKLGNRTYRQHLPHSGKISGFQCTYNPKGKLVEEAPYKGTFDYMAPSLTVFKHPKSALKQIAASLGLLASGWAATKIPGYAGMDPSTLTNTLNHDVLQLVNTVKQPGGAAGAALAVFSSPYWGHLLIDVLPHLGHNRYETPDKTKMWQVSDYKKTDPTLS